MLVGRLLTGRSAVLRKQGADHIIGVVWCRNIFCRCMEESVLSNGCCPLYRRPPHSPPVVHVLSSFLQVEGTELQLGDSKPRVVVLLKVICVKEAFDLFLAKSRMAAN